nr:uncharacterized protein LOC109147873 [Ipomoea trifida]
MEKETKVTDDLEDADSEKEMDRRFSEAVRSLRAQEAAAKAKMKAIGVEEVPPLVDTENKDDRQVKEKDRGLEKDQTVKGVSFAKEPMVFEAGDPSSSKGMDRQPIGTASAHQSENESMGGKGHLSHPQTACENAQKSKGNVMGSGMQGNTLKGGNANHPRPNAGEGAAWGQRTAEEQQYEDCSHLYDKQSGGADLGIPVSKNGFEGLRDLEEGEKDYETENEKSEGEQGGRVEVGGKEGEGETEGEEDESDESSEEEGASDHEAGAEVSVGISEGSGTDQLAKKAEMEMDLDKNLQQMNLSPRKPPDKPPDKPKGKAKKQAANPVDKPMRVTRSRSKGDPVGGVFPDCFCMCFRWRGFLTFALLLVLIMCEFYEGGEGWDCVAPLVRDGNHIWDPGKGGGGCANMVSVAAAELGGRMQFGAELSCGFFVRNSRGAFCIAGVYTAQNEDLLVDTARDMLLGCIQWCKSQSITKVAFETDDWRGLDTVDFDDPTIRCTKLKCASRINAVAVSLVNCGHGLNVMYLRKEGLPRGLGRILALEGIPHFVFGPGPDVI